MQIAETDKALAEKPVGFTVKLDISKLLGFRHIEIDTTDERFAQDAAAAFNKIGINGEGPPSCVEM